ncbi:MAG: hypothetical protein JRG74_05605, partial [Deltaproteobacteria bacterium]|nr:hypothetical protein [Deltaproteobacteria bacterium]
MYSHAGAWEREKPQTVNRERVLKGNQQMKVATFQTDPILLDIKANLEDTISKIHHAKEK